jgi:hypothetical protein
MLIVTDMARALASCEAVVGAEAAGGDRNAGGMHRRALDHEIGSSWHFRDLHETELKS